MLSKRLVAHKIVGVAHHSVVAATGLAPLGPFVLVQFPSFCRPLVELVEVDVGEQR